MQLTSDRHFAYSRLFSSAVFREMAESGKSALFTRLLKQTLILDGFSSLAKVGDAFDAAFKVLCAVENRDEYIYKAALTHKVLLGKHSLRTASMLTEYRVGSCKADIVILNGTATVYEIKSERDTLDRLGAQLESYRKVFASVYVICGKAHIRQVMNLAPPDVGVLELSSRYRISSIRAALDAPERISPLCVLDSLRVDEALKILDSLAISRPDVPNTKIRATLKEIFSDLPARKLHDSMVATLKKTRDLLPLTDLVGALPQSLYAAALSLSIKKSEHERLISAVNTKIKDAIHWT